MALTVTVTGPHTAVTGFSATPTTGGSLTASTTYYYRVFALETFNTDYAGDILRSVDSGEQSFTTGVGQTACDITWTAKSALASGTIKYNVYVYPTSGVLPATARNATGSSVSTTSTNSYKVLALGNQCAHDTTFGQLTYPAGGFAKTAGTIFVSCSGTATSDPLGEIHAAVLASAGANYCFYDSTYFILKGSHRNTGSTSGSMNVYRKTVHYFQGIVSNSNTNFIMNFGAYDATAKAAYDGCNIIISQWLPQIQPNAQLKFNGCTFRRTANDENLFAWGDSWHYWAAGSASLYNDFYNSAVDVPADYSRMSLAWFYPRSSGATYTGLYLKGRTNASNFFHYSAYTGNNLYDCVSEQYLSSTTFHIQSQGAGGGAGSAWGWYDSDFRDQNRAVTANNRPYIRHETGNCTNSETLYNSIVFKVVEENVTSPLATTPISGALCVVKDNTGTAVLTQTSNASGLTTKTYIARDVSSKTDTTSTGNDYVTPSLTTWTTKNPMTLKITASGYETVEFPFTLTEKKSEWIIKMKRKR